MVEPENAVQMEIIGKLMKTFSTSGSFNRFLAVLEEVMRLMGNAGNCFKLN
jgi:biotin synthase-related radical SAM superfamily protein